MQNNIVVLKLKANFYYHWSQSRTGLWHWCLQPTTNGSFFVVVCCFIVVLLVCFFLIIHNCSFQRFGKIISLIWNWQQIFIIDHNQGQNRIIDVFNQQQKGHFLSLFAVFYCSIMHISSIWLFNKRVVFCLCLLFFVIRLVFFNYLWLLSWNRQHISFIDSNQGQDGIIVVFN